MVVYLFIIIHKSKIILRNTLKGEKDTDVVSVGAQKQNKHLIVLIF